MYIGRMVFMKRFVPAFIVLSTTYALYIVYVYRETFSEEDRKQQLARMDRMIKSEANSFACTIPNVPVDSPEMMKFVEDVLPIDCSSAEPDWVTVEGSTLRITERAKQTYGDVTCQITDLLRQDDYWSKDGKTVKTRSSYELGTSDVVRVTCSSKSGHTWRSVLTGIRRNPAIAERIGWTHLDTYPNSMRMNVLMFGFDSLSRNTVIRKLPKTYEFFTKVLEGQVLEGYNIVGDGTPQALLPILTGKTELELPEARVRVPGANYLDAFPFVWKDYFEAGYVTGFLEDVPHIGTFTYRLKGFKNSPTDHYMRPYYISAEWGSSPDFCAGSIPRHQIMLNHIKNFFSVYKNEPKFLFGFHGELSHDTYNLIGAADDDVLRFMKSMHASNALNNTIFILMADHGHRFAKIRDTMQGKLEERLPFFGFAFPKWFRHKFPEAYANFVHNKRVLTTPFDIYATLKSVLYGFPPRADLTERSLSLFSKISAERSCSNAYIEPHWCSCLSWEAILTSSPIVTRLVDVVIDELNSQTASLRDRCATLSVLKIEWVSKLQPNADLLRFKQSADKDGMVPDLSNTYKPDKHWYQIKVVTKPGDGSFEATLTHFLNDDRIELRMSDVSRINMYGSQARCVEKDYPDLRKYCYCIRN